MERTLLTDLVHWKDKPHRLPLLLRGARQVGKTYLVEQFGKTHFEQCVTLNFELRPLLKSCFDSLIPAEIIQKIGVLTNTSIIPGKTLLFLDEVQECPSAIMALRFFKEQMSPLHIIAAGSLLEFALDAPDFRMPVGRMEYLFLYPLSFREFVMAVEEHTFLDFLSRVTPVTPIPEAIHQKGIQLFRLYSLLGGMPAVVHIYLTTRSLLECQMRQSTLLHAYKNDFGKFTAKGQFPYIQQVYEKIPILVGQRLKYKHIDPDARAQDLRHAMTLLKKAGLLHIIYASKASALPLSSQTDEKRFKWLFLDGGLVVRACGLDSLLLLENDLLLINRGALAEQWVGQELLGYQPAYEPGGLFFWVRDHVGSEAEVDYVLAWQSHLIPVEVKAGSTGKLQSLKRFLLEKQSPLGIRVAQLPLQWRSPILTLPFYLIHEWQRLVKEALHH